MYLDNCSILAARNISKTSYVVDEYIHVPRKKTLKENPMYLSCKSCLSHWAVVSHWAVNDCRCFKDQIAKTAGKHELSYSSPSLSFALKTVIVCFVIVGLVELMIWVW